MAQPYVGEIRLFAGTFAPAGWALCHGQPLPISEFETIFQLIGTTYGGDGEETFNMPNLQGRVPIHQGQGPGLSQNYQLGESAGVESVTLTTNQIPNHNHAALVSTGPGNVSTPTNAIPADSASVQIYIEDSPDSNFGNVVGITGGSQPHDNMQPFVCVNYIISLFGIYPSPT